MSEVAKRHNGFVVGADISRSKKSIWKVRVNDDTSPHNGKKMIVASIRGDIELAQGLNVHFEIGTLAGTGGEDQLRAVDVRLSAAD